MVFGSGRSPRSGFSVCSSGIFLPFQSNSSPIERISLVEVQEVSVIRKLKSGEYRLYSRKKDAKTGKRKNLGTFSTMEKAKQHEKAVQYFKRAS
jgi:hypothetical protein